MRGAQEVVTAESDEELWVRLAPELVRYARVLVGRTDAHDVLVESFLRARRVGWDRISNVRAYLYRAITNEARNLGRSRLRRAIREVDQRMIEAPLVDEALVDVRMAVADLSVRQRAVIYLSYWRDLPEAEVAGLLEMSRSSVRRHHDRACHKLRKALQ